MSHVPRAYGKAGARWFVNEEDNQVAALKRLPVCGVEVLAFHSALLRLPHVRTRKQDIFDFISKDTMLFRDLVDKGVFPDHVA